MNTYYCSDFRFTFKHAVRKSKQMSKETGEYWTQITYGYGLWAVTNKYHPGVMK